LIRALVRHLLQLILITAVFVPVAVALPLCSLWLCLTPEGAMAFFWLGPWSCCFWALILHVLVGSKFWRGRGSVKAWRAEKGGYVRSCIESTGLMFGSLFLSYGCEFACVFLLQSSESARFFLPAATFAPAVFVFWRAARG
jgi:hypothetical protein